MGVGGQVIVCQIQKCRDDEIQMLKKFFSTSDLPLAAYLKLQNYSIARIQRAGDGRASFVFHDNPERGELLLKFFNRETEIEPLAFLDQIRNLKSLIKQG